MREGEGAVLLFAVCLFGGLVASLVGVFMWLGAWATFAVFGLLVALFGVLVLHVLSPAPYC
jgi:hypothetical protein